MPSTREYMLCKDGVFMVETTRTAVGLSPAIKEALVGDVMFECRNVASGASNTGLGPIHLKADKRGFQYWTAEVNFIKLNCRFKTNKEGIMMPRFQPQENDKDPILSIAWTRPSTMRIRLMAIIEQHGQIATYFMMTAFDGTNMPYKLPLPNLYDDTQMCLGSGFKPTGASGGDTFHKVVDQFIKSEWNSDLYTPEVQRRTEKLFRFRAQNDGFVQINPEGGWEALCDKVSPQKIAMVTL